MYYVYIIRSQKTDELYKGSTADLRKRFGEHNSKRVTATKHGIPWKLIYYEGFEFESDARREELFLKSGKGRERLKWLFQNSK